MNIVNSVERLKIIKYLSISNPNKSENMNTKNA